MELAILDDLAARELDILKRLPPRNINVERQIEDIISNGVFHEYSEIYGSYVDTFVNYGDEESLKRALFIQWSAACRPCYLTGIPNCSEDSKHVLNANLEGVVISGIANRINAKSIGPELSMMLTHYYTQGYCYFISSEVRKRFGELIVNCIYFKEIDWRMVSTQNRGQMGIYWRSCF